MADNTFLRSVGLKEALHVQIIFYEILMLVTFEVEVNFIVCIWKDQIMGDYLSFRVVEVNYMV
jgi:hypothetical protein